MDLKPISVDAIPRALAKAERYRLLNEPRDAESICRDILRVQPGNQDAKVTLLLALTDQFGKGLLVGVNHAEELVADLDDDYRRHYYSGVLHERWAKAQLQEGAPGYVVYDWLCKAVGEYEQAEVLSPPGNDDAILRRNACARIIKRNPELGPRMQDQSIEAGFHDG